MFVAIDFFAPFAEALAFFYKLIPNYGVAIALLTLAVMLVLTPLTLKGTRSMMIMQSLQPEMKKIQAQYKDDRQKLNEELLKFYRENNINPLGGCIPLLIQLPVFLILYRVIKGLTHIGPNGTIDPQYLNPSSELYQSLKGSTEMRAFGMNLAESATKALQHSFVSVLPYLVLIIGVAATSVIQQRQISGRNPAAASNPQQQMLMKLGPIMITGISLVAPGGLVIYFFVSNLYRVGQQALISRTIYNTPEAKKLLEQQHKQAEEKKKAGGGAQKGFLQRMLGDAAPPQIGKAKSGTNGSGGKTSPDDKSGPGGGTNKPPAAKSNGGRTTPAGNRSAAARKKKRRK